ncbi:MaoC/PaaZ C-terminal domain-containing protein [Blastococcus brunescens]|uniref:MaoC/PaaZ C-terminal domain-containing protein n=1 Tax=Blastococcus brunescens TaxID=1564165 RepID=A0ABZ1B6W0_9ACTN|nr:MaoC/PaaZ C-terminal domain-containing protein [Blastococcus sp. BMG 8361]WRL66521.1 MaoC/PaaZ C-terminal domain-containing protein [Blastococcus sp. BMG 8361]
MTERWFEDYVVGTTTEHGSIRVDEDEVVDFGRRFDPQPFHVDAEAALAGPYGGLIASGWHTCALMMRLLAREYLSPSRASARPGSTSCAGSSRCARATSCRCAPPSRRPACPAASPIAGCCGPGSNWWTPAATSSCGCSR